MGCGVGFSRVGSGVAVTVPTLLCCTPPAGAGSAPVPYTTPSRSSVVAGQLIAEDAITSSVTVTLLRATPPVLRTVYVTAIMSPASTATPGALFASSPLIDLTIDTPGFAAT